MKAKIARHLLRLGAVFLRPDQPFTWTSGIISPIYCDNRLILSDHAARADVALGLAALIQSRYPETEILMGTSTAGIPHAALAAHFLSLPMGYVRGSAKAHGRQNRIEGRLAQGQKVVVVEDLISSAKSVLETAEALREAGAEVLGIASIFTYQMQKGLQALAEANLSNASLTDFDAVVAEAVAQNIISAADLPKLAAFRDNPDDPAWREVTSL